MNRILTVVVAAGRGQRMGSETPKQFLIIDSQPVVMHTLRRIYEAVENYLDTEYPFRKRIVENTVDNLSSPRQNVDNACISPKIVNTPVHNLVLLLPPDSLGLWQELCTKYSFDIPHRAIAGGATRFASVRNGLQADPQADVVLVHDGVRPFPGDWMVEQVIRGTLCYGAAVPVVPVTDSLRRWNETDSPYGVAVDRSQFRAVQTPQGFCGEWLREAYAGDEEPGFTDDASVVETRTDNRVVMVAGEPSNIKITSPLDLAAAEAWIKTFRSGQ